MRAPKVANKRESRLSAVVETDSGLSDELGEDDSLNDEDLVESELKKMTGEEAGSPAKRALSRVQTKKHIIEERRKTLRKINTKKNSTTSFK